MGKQIETIRSLPISNRGQKVHYQQDEQSLRTIIRDMGMKVTDQRLLIMRTLQEGRAHVTAQEVFEQVQKKDTTVGFATVYRFLRSLIENEYATEVRMGGMPARYELQSGNHHDHLTCTQCGKICEFENNKIEQLQETVAKQFGFHLTSHVLELYGVCPDCQRRKSTSLALKS